MFSSVTIAYMWHWQMASRSSRQHMLIPLQLKQLSVLHDLAVLGLTAMHAPPVAVLK